MFNHVVYDVFIKGEDDFKSEETGLRGMSRFGDNLTAFSEKGLKFKSVSLPRALALSLTLYPYQHQLFGPSCRTIYSWRRVLLWHSTVPFCNVYPTHTKRVVVMGYFSSPVVVNREAGSMTAEV